MPVAGSGDNGPMTKSISESINRNWFQKDGPGRVGWTFDEDVRALPDDELSFLLRLYEELFADHAERGPSKYETDSLRNTGKLAVGSTTITIADIGLLLRVLMLCEHRFRSISFLPPEMRRQTLEAIARDVGWPLGMIRRVDKWWSSAGNRNLVMAD